ncbi:MAG TPA: hypothetical protein VMF69_28455 [Gemmataceae bacterium]|nr:hypothetical protein [Gemmataceae bacterium]
MRDLQGNAVAEPDGEDPFLTPLPLPAKLSVEEHSDWDQRIRSFADGRVPSGYWYFIADGRHDGGGYFVGYDSESRACLGYLGRDGLQERPLPIEDQIPFGGTISGAKGRLLCTQKWRQHTEHPVNRRTGRAPHGSASMWDVYVLGCDGKLYHADLQRRTIEVAFDRSPVLSTVLIGGQHDAVHGTPCRPAVRTVDAVLILDERGEVLKRYPIPESLRGHEISFAETSTEKAVMYANSPEDFLAPEVEYRICLVDSAGNYQQVTTTLPFLGVKRVLPLAGLVIPSPLVLGGTVALLRPSALLDYGSATTYPEALGRSLMEFWTALAITQIIAFGFAVLCYRRQVRYGSSRTERIVWPMFVLLFGLPGWIGYRFGRSWPVLESCPECGVAVPRDRESCLRCTSDFPRPALKGTEVFA